MEVKSSMEYGKKGRRLRNPLKIISNLWSYHELISQFIKRELIGRYRGSYLGIFWSFLTPLFMLVVYTFVFSVIFKARWGMGSTSKTEFALTLFCGLIAFNLFSEVVGRAPGLILGNVNYVKKVVFPLEILPLVSLGSSLIHAMISTVILLVGLIVTTGTFNWTTVFLPVVLLPLLLLSLGLGWFLSSIGVFLRDIGHVIGIILSALMFLSPIFYPISAIPEQFRAVYYINPLSYVVEDMRRIIIWGQMPHWESFLINMVISIAIALFGYMWFQRTRGGFADVL
ncbi:ABC transporter permease [Aneurinibacillus aneurinilyticus]|uniref:ABC transporter permease n=1 Tax=Aneurinibacillus aneurinilyticus TaxID=1391 RepID=UPI002E1DF438|nr:ABC transporter permease [Aneurinibacillus aneurinilyticus]